MAEIKAKRTIDDVTRVAKSFLMSQGYTLYIKLIGAEFNASDGTWTVSYDVGAFNTIIRRVIINDADGNIIGFK